MRLRPVLYSATMLAAPLLFSASGQAQPVTGLYIAAGAGANILQDEHVKAPSLNLVPKRLSTQVGGAGVASVGWGFGNGLRVEVEGDIRHNRVHKLTGFVNGNPTAAGGDQYAYGGMVNALFDMDIGYNWIYPYFGVGAGAAATRLDDLHVYSTGRTPVSVSSNSTSTNFAYQGIFGLAFPLAAVPGLSLTTEYRFYGVLNSPEFNGRESNSSANRVGHLKINDDYNHSLIMGVRYAFNTAPPMPVAPPLAAIPAPTPARTYLVFFDWDRSDLTERARQIVGEAAAASTRVQSTRIEVQGNADRSGTPAYNQGLSRRRADMVAAELVRRGVPKSAIDIQAFGDTHPLVPTAAGVREPQNRRVAIILH